MGDEVFFALLRTWVDENRYGVVTTADFEASVLDVTGHAHADLLDGWLRETALPELPARFESPTDPAALLRAAGSALSRRLRG